MPNPNYTLWFDQDQVLLSILVSSLSKNILAQMVGISTSRAAWVALETIFSSHSRARAGAVQTRQLLSVMKKGNQSIFDYFQKIKTHADTLAAIGKPLLPHEFQSYLLGGLDSTYDAIVNAIITQSNPMRREDLFSHLLNFELQLEHHNSALEATIGSHNKFRGRGRAGRGKGGPRQQSSSRPLCQVCGKTGHTAIQCYHRFDQAYQGAPPPMVAYVTAQQSPPDANWYPDTGSTHHLTNDFQNLNIHSEPYTGSDQIHVGDGAGLSIHNIGSCKLYTSSHSFSLSHLLHVPHIQKNLIFVSQFTNDNHVFIEFHSSYFLVKDETTGRIILHGKTKDGLYRFPSDVSSSTQLQSFTCQRVSLEMWHSRMGHPSYQTVRRLISQFSIPVSTNEAPGCVFLGFSNMHRGYKCLDPSTGKIIVSRHVVFDEHVFPFSHPTPASPRPVSPQPDTTFLPFPIPFQSGPLTDISPTLFPTVATVSTPLASPPAVSDFPFVSPSTPPSSTTPCSSPSTAHDPPTLAVAADVPVARPH
ncbi:hypothetical protein F0562_031305 [Nyssa sinensis]|uniref:Uncharacterized protein n=1 Tax=Nyssa sinensis TaxID=561372 RepID=A0A5J5ATV3_9ASTE|nr:hypothetical protein F0562_031305 [Nyssa sinensis]